MKRRWQSLVRRSSLPDLARGSWTVGLLVFAAAAYAQDSSPTKSPGDEAPRPSKVVYIHPDKSFLVIDDGKLQGYENGVEVCFPSTGRRPRCAYVAASNTTKAGLRLRLRDMRFIQVGTEVKVRALTDAERQARGLPKRVRADPPSTEGSDAKAGKRETSAKERGAATGGAAVGAGEPQGSRAVRSPLGSSPPSSSGEAGASPGADLGVSPAGAASESSASVGSSATSGPQGGASNTPASSSASATSSASSASSASAAGEAPPPRGASAGGGALPSPAVASSTPQAQAAASAAATAKDSSKDPSRRPTKASSATTSRKRPRVPVRLGLDLLSPLRLPISYEILGLTAQDPATGRAEWSVRGTKPAPRLGLGFHAGLSLGGPWSAQFSFRRLDAPGVAVENDVVAGDGASYNRVVTNASAHGLGATLGRSSPFFLPWLYWTADAGFNLLFSEVTLQATRHDVEPAARWLIADARSSLTQLGVQAGAGLGARIWKIGATLSVTFDKPLARLSQQSRIVVSSSDEPGAEGFLPRGMDQELERALAHRPAAWGLDLLLGLDVWL